MKKIIGIYAIRNTVDGKTYIGQATDIHARWRIHRCILAKGKHHNLHLQRAFAKHGAQKFVFEIVESLDLTGCPIKEAVDRLSMREQWWMNHCGVGDPNRSYNIYPIARSCLGVKRDANFRAKCSARRWSAAERIKLSTSHLGITPANASLSRKQIVEIKERLSRRESCVSIANDYSVNRSVIYSIKNGTCYSDIEHLDERFQKGAAKGSAQGQAKLDEKQVATIKRRMIDEGVTSLAKEFHVSQAAVSNIKSGKTWAHVAVEAA